LIREVCIRHVIRTTALLLLTCCTVVSWAQTAISPGVISPPSTTPPAANLNNLGQGFQEAQNPLFGSVPSGQVTPGVITIAPLDAIQRGLKYNLALLLSDQATENARGARYRALADVIPNINGRIAEQVQQVNLAAFGIPFPPGTPLLVGPFAVFDARALATGNIDLRNLNLLHSRSEDVKSAQLNYQNARDLIVLAVGGVYMQALAAAARIDATEAQLRTADTLFKHARDMKAAGMVPALDVLRAQVEMQVVQQRLLVARNDFDKQKLRLARLIGLPVAQQFTIVNTIPLTPPSPLTVDQAIERAYRDRPDYQSARFAVRSAEWNRKSAVAERLPSFQVSADYGALGKRPGDAQQTYTVTTGLRIPIFQGGKIRGDILQADALLNRRKSELDDLRGRIEFEVRSAFLDLQSASDQLQVAQSSVGLAQEALTQAQDRFRAGVATNIEVVQAQEALATTNENYINSTFIFNVAKLSLARSLGAAERAVIEFLGGKQ
jgi:outer membrane protein TolC